MWSESKLFINFPTTYISRPNIFFKNIAENGCGLFILEVELNALKKTILSFWFIPKSIWLFLLFKNFPFNMFLL